MPYIGKQAAAGQTETVKDSFNGDNSTTAFTMSQSVSLDTDIEVFVGNVQQEPGSGKAYVVSGTTLTFSEAPPTGTGNIYVIHRNSLQGTLLPPQNLGDRNYLIGGDLSLDADGAALKFGVDSEITLTHSADSGLLLKHANTADDSIAVLTFQTGDTDIAVDDVLGRIDFQAPDEATGTDAILVAASITAVSEGDFSSSSNATGLRFATGASETATTKMILTSGGDLKLDTDGSSLFFGADSEIELRHVADDGLILKHVGTGDGKEPSLTFQAGDTDIAQDDVLGQINFQAPDEGTGTDAILVAASIAAVSEGDFSSSSNATKLSFKTGASEAAAEKMSLSSAGLLTVSGRIITDDTTEATSTTDGSLQTDGGLSVAKDIVAGDDIKLLSDASVIHFGADSEITLTHVHDTGLSLNTNLTVTRADNGDNLSLVSTDGDAGGGPALSFYRNSASPADDDTMCTIRFEGNNDASQLVIYSKIRADIGDASDGTEDGTLHIFNMVAGTERTMLSLKSSEIVFNDESRDIDFRVESDGNANMLTVNGENDIVGIGIDPNLTGNTAAAQAQINSTTQYTGLGFGTGASSSVISGAANAGMYFTSNAAPANLGGGDKVVFTFASGTSGGSGPSDLIKIQSDGKMGVGNSGAITSSSQFTVTAGTNARVMTVEAGGTSSNDAILIKNGNGEVGSVRTSGSATAFNTSSDYRLKENVNYDWDATSRLKQLKPARFNFKADADLTVDGFLAHEVSSIVPEAISGTKDETQDLGIVKNKDGDVIYEDVLETLTEKDEGQTWTKTKTKNVYQGIDQSKLVPLLVKTIQELEARITVLESA